MPMMLPATVPPLERDFLLSAALVSLALFGAFVSCADVKTVDVSTPKVFMGLKVGAMLLYWFSAMTMKSVGSYCVYLLCLLM
ncbi:putative inorganic diphosphatase [Helianthus annuus]|nr:putative inorganic diphosphatase [Helianthus annuus]